MPKRPGSPGAYRGLMRFTMLFTGGTTGFALALLQAVPGVPVCDYIVSWRWGSGLPVLLAFAQGLVFPSEGMDHDRSVGEADPSVG